jgi:c-di-GMP-binding flagellar brake protein YcgR
MAEAASTVSKRSSLRFAGFDWLVIFRTEYEDGEARLVNISTGGCALHLVSLPLAIDQKLLVSLILDNPGNPLQMRAMVTRIEADCCGLKFQHVEESAKRKLVRFFAKETRLRQGEQTVTPA